MVRNIRYKNNGLNSLGLSKISKKLIVRFTHHVNFMYGSSYTSPVLSLNNLF